MKYSALKQIQRFRHYGVPFVSNEHARLLIYGHVYCWVLLLE